MIYAIIPTGNRAAEYKNVYDFCIKNDITPVTIATSKIALDYSKGDVLATEKINISLWWNMGIKFAHEHDAEFILVLNDDVNIPDGWLENILTQLRAGASGASGERGEGKISGFAFGLNGKDNVLADENLVWWYGDDDIQRQCEALSGFAIIPNLPVENYYANSSYSRFQQQIAKDRQYYEWKWGN